MPAPSWEDLDDVLEHEDDGGFAINVVFSLQAGGTQAATGIFEEPYYNAELGEYDMDTTRPRFWGKEIDLQTVRRGDTVPLGGSTYDVMAGAQPDGTGMAMVELAKQGA